MTSWIFALVLFSYTICVHFVALLRSKENEELIKNYETEVKVLQGKIAILTKALDKKERCSAYRRAGSFS